jgi:hypothetical protein
MRTALKALRYLPTGEKASLGLVCMGSVVGASRPGLLRCFLVHVHRPNSGTMNSYMDKN